MGPPGPRGLPGMPGIPGMKVMHFVYSTIYLFKTINANKYPKAKTRN